MLLAWASGHHLIQLPFGTGPVASTWVPLSTLWRSPTVVVLWSIWEAVMLLPCLCAAVVLLEADLTEFWPMPQVLFLTPWLPRKHWDCLMKSKAVFFQKFWVRTGRQELFPWGQCAKCQNRVRIISLPLSLCRKESFFSLFQQQSLRFIKYSLVRGWHHRWSCHGRLRSWLVS